MQIPHSIVTVRHADASINARFYTLHRVPDETGGLSYEPGIGTVLTKPFVQAYEYRIYERDRAGYIGLCGQFAETKFAEALTCFFALANLDL